MCREISVFEVEERGIAFSRAHMFSDVMTPCHFRKDTHESEKINLFAFSLVVWHGNVEKEALSSGVFEIEAMHLFVRVDNSRSMPPLNNPRT